VEEQTLVSPAKKLPKRLRLTVLPKTNATSTGALSSTDLRNERTERAIDTLKTSRDLLSDIILCVNQGTGLRNEAQLGAQLISQFLESTVRGSAEEDRLVNTLRTCKNLFRDIEMARNAGDPAPVAKLAFELIQHIFESVLI
jgi:hypothetical protein